MNILIRVSFLGEWISIMLNVLGFNLVGDGQHDVLGPQMKN
ncbi:hypothetical protein MKZ23_04800 [Paenibacillus sp. FSL R5-0876]